MKASYGKPEVVLEKEKGEFEESLWNTLHKKVQDGRPTVDILEVKDCKGG